MTQPLTKGNFWVKDKQYKAKGRIYDQNTKGRIYDQNKDFSHNPALTLTLALLVYP